MSEFMVQDDLGGNFSRCLRCEKRLSDPRSREVGMGPTCRKRLEEIARTILENNWAGMDIALARTLVPDMRLRLCEQKSEVVSP